VLVPFAVIEAVAGPTVECAALTAPGCNVITQVDKLTAVPTAVPFSVAVTVAVPVPTDVGAVQVAVYVPLPLSVVALIVPDVAEKTTVPPPAE
jgi:hypothetical protein